MRKLQLNGERTMSPVIRLMSSFVTLLSVPALAWALQTTQPQASQPASNPSGLPEGPLTIFVTRVIGKVQYRAPGSDKWQFAKD